MPLIQTVVECEHEWRVIGYVATIYHGTWKVFYGCRNCPATVVRTGQPRSFYRRETTLRISREISPVETLNSSQEDD